MCIAEWEKNFTYRDLLVFAISVKTEDNIPEDFGDVNGDVKGLNDAWVSIE